MLVLLRQLLSSYLESEFKKVCDIRIIFVGMRRILSTFDTIDILCLVYSNFCINEIMVKFPN